MNAVECDKSGRKYHSNDYRFGRPRSVILCVVDGACNNDRGGEICWAHQWLLISALLPSGNILIWADTGALELV